MIHKKLSYSLLLIDMLQVFFFYYIVTTLNKNLFWQYSVYEWSLKVIWSQVCQPFALRRIFPISYEYVCGHTTFTRQTERERENKERIYTMKLTEVTLGGFCFVFFLIRASWNLGSQFPNQGLNPHPPHWKHRVFTTGQPGKSRIRRDLY